MKEILHVSLLLVVWFIGIVSRHGVQEGPSFRTQFIFIQRTIFSIIIVLSWHLILLFFCLLDTIYEILYNDNYYCLRMNLMT